MKQTGILTACLSLGVVLGACDKQEVQEQAAEQKPVAAEPGRDPAVASRIRKEIGAILGKSPDAIKDTDAFIKNLGADSLDTVEIVMATEEAFEISIEDADAGKLVTVGDLIDYVCARIKTAPRSLKKTGAPTTDAMISFPSGVPIRVMAGCLEAGSRTEELAFDWIVKPFENESTPPG